MDYIREEFLRQQRVLIVLMHGHGGHVEESGEGLTRTSDGSDLVWEALESYTNGTKISESAATEWIPETKVLREFEQAAGGPAVRLLRRGARDAVALEVWGEETAGLPLGQMDLGGRRSPAFRAAGRAVARMGRKQRESRAVQELPYGGIALGTQTVQLDAQAVSRAIQRDSRRYDGGFLMY